MTDEERQKFVEFLRYYRENSEYGRTWADKAADEIERLAHIVKEARKLLGENFERPERETDEPSVWWDKVP
jgi:hypothetical protein